MMNNLYNAFYGGTYSVRHEHEIENLKRDWASDPCWDIEDTAGFEVWHDDLLAWRQEYEAELNRRETLRVGLKTAELGISAALLEYIEHLEWRIAQLEKAATS